LDGAIRVAGRSYSAWKTWILDEQFGMSEVDDEMPNMAARQVFLERDM
jgi:hypothetical protein